MSRVNDVGGVEGFGSVQREDAEPPFHADWEAHVFAMNRALIGAGVYTLDDDERADVLRALDEIKHGELASDDEAAALFKRLRG